jgi:hypothetical protein
MNQRSDDITKEEFVKQHVNLWLDVCVNVYLFKPNKINMLFLQQDAERVWDGTKLTPMADVINRADPDYPTNWAKRGQKARAKRWKEWVKKHAPLA